MKLTWYEENAAKLVRLSMVFAKADVALLDEAVDTTVSWVRRNFGSYDLSGHLVAEPWWRPKLDKPKEVILLEERGRDFERRLFGTALAKFLYTAAEKFRRENVDDGDEAKLRVRVATIVSDQATWEIVAATMKKDLGSQEYLCTSNNINFSEAKALCKYSMKSGNSGTRRDLMRMAQSGLILWNPGKTVSDGHMIRIGPVGKRFYVDVFSPIARDKGKYIEKGWDSDDKD